MTHEELHQLAATLNREGEHLLACAILAALGALRDGPEAEERLMSILSCFVKDGLHRLDPHGLTKPIQGPGM